MFNRANDRAWQKSDQQRPLSLACKHANISPAVTFHMLRHTYGSTLAMRGVPMPVIAKQLGHTETRMTEKHYAHLSASYVADTVRANFPILGIMGKSKVARIDGRKR
jgi:integrase